MAASVIPDAPDQVLEASHQSDHSEPRVTTVLVCDNTLLRSGLQGILRGTPFAPAMTASAANLTLVQDVVPEFALVLVEASQNTGRVLEVLPQVRRQSPEARIVVLADRFDPTFVRLGHEAGVNGFCSAASGPAVLVKSLELIMLGESVLPYAVLRSIMEASLQNWSQPLPDSPMAEPKQSELKTCKLSTREAQILSCLREGAPNKVIARKLEITEATIKVHVKAILRKIGVANRTQAAMWASQRLPRQVGASGHV
jgi:two-component system, NarL family, nitrate/nitrite response regulator NarL